MKITRISKTGSAPDLGSGEEDTRNPPIPASPGSPSGGERSPWHVGFPSEATKSEDADASLALSPSSFSAPATPQLADGLKYAPAMANRGRLFANHSRLAKRRLVQKNGECNVKSRNVTKRKRKYIVDIFTTLVDMKWRYHLLLFALFFVVTWCAFGGIWYAIAAYHLDDVHADNDNWTKCVDNVFDYNSALLFSIETQTTIGYGFRVIQPECGFGIFVMMVQSCVGLFIQSLITGVIFSKISRPKGRAQTIMFSERAAVCKRDGEFCLTFRVGDMRKSHIIGTSIRALLVKNRLTAEGESMPLCQYPVDLETETSRSDSFVFLVWPVTVVHRIVGAASPLWDLSPEKLLTEHFELIVILEGTVESTGMTTQVRTSYVPSEIMWGQRLVPLLTFQLKNGQYEIDHKQFHNTTPTAMPDCSAKEYADRKAGLTPDEIQREADYPVSFTAPAIRAKGTTPDRQLYAIFQRNIEGIIRKRGPHHGKDHAKFKVADGGGGGGGHANRAYAPRSRPHVDHLVHELHHAGPGRIQDGASDALKLQPVRRVHSADDKVEMSEIDSGLSLEVPQQGSHEMTSI